MERLADTRTCQQCGVLFTRRREHARFCSAACRVVWNRENSGDPQAEASALDWSTIAMRQAVERLARDKVRDQAQAFEIISEAVWRVTIVDATLVRYHDQAYESVLEAQARAERLAIEGTLAGLRFVRNQMGYHLDPVDFIQPEKNRPGSNRGITTWAWRSLLEPALGWLPPHGQAWEMTRYRAYEAHLAGHTLGETFGRTATLLNLASATQAAAMPVGPY